MNLENAMADAILRAILARPRLSTVQDGRIPSELWDAAYEYHRASQGLERAREEYRRDGTITEWPQDEWMQWVTKNEAYRAALAKFSDVLPEILKNLSTENE